MTETINNFAKAFIAAQSDMVNAKKDESNPFFKSRYADFNSVREACVPILNKHNIGVLQPTVSIDGKNYVKTILLHESGESMESLTEIIFAKQTDAQAQGSGITYARRYGLQSLVAIGAEDDDGNKAAEKEPKKTTRNASGISLDGPLADGSEMRETFEPENAKKFSNIKFLIESCEDLEALSKLWNEAETKKVLNQFKKYDTNRHTMLIEAKDLMKLALDPESQDVAKLKNI